MKEGSSEIFFFLRFGKLVSFLTSSKISLPLIVSVAPECKIRSTKDEDFLEWVTFSISIIQI